MRSEDKYAKKKGAKTDSGFHDIETFINMPPHKYAGVQSIPDFVQRKKSDDISPLELADLIDRDVEAASATLDKFGAAKNKELQLTLSDIAIICEMGRYYADKIRGATYVAMARHTKVATDKDNAVDALTQAAQHYENYVRLVKSRYVSRMWFNRVGILDFEEQNADVLADVETAKQLPSD
jgi:hypothetical protein